MTRIIVLVVMVLLGSQAAFAQDADEAASRGEIALRIVERTWGDTRRTVEIVRDQLAATMPIEQREVFRQLLDEVFDFERYKKLNVALMVRHFTVAELDALDRFYASDEGQSVMKKMPIMMGEMMPIMQQLMLDAVKRIPRDKRPPQLRDI